MTLIFGGAYQGKLAYAQSQYAVKDADIYHCNDETAADLPGDKKIINNIDQWILAQIKAEADIPTAITHFINANPTAIVICTDISCGIVPMDATMRKWRDQVGRAMAQLSAASDQVVRMFCGIPTKIKG